MNVACKISVAFAQDDFYCSSPMPDSNEDPAAYTSYCLDTNHEIDCTHIRECFAMYDKNTKKTTCCEWNFITSTRYKKQELSVKNKTCNKNFAVP
jgi:hypothetical protein